MKILQNLTKGITSKKNLLTPIEQGLIYTVSDADPAQKRATEIAYARLFSGEDGQRVLAHLQSCTFQRAYGPEVTDAQLRYTEGQRALVATILRLIESGRRPN